jgi:hypothetical protein
MANRLNQSAKMLSHVGAQFIAPIENDLPAGWEMNEVLAA